MRFIQKRPAPGALCNRGKHYTDKHYQFELYQEMSEWKRDIFYDLKKTDMIYWLVTFNSIQKVADHAKNDYYFFFPSSWDWDTTQGDLK